MVRNNASIKSSDQSYGKETDSKESTENVETLSKESECSICFESFTYSNSVDRYFHYQRHLKEKRPVPGLERLVTKNQMEEVQKIQMNIKKYKVLAQSDPSAKVILFHRIFFCYYVTVK